MKWKNYSEILTYTDEKKLSSRLKVCLLIATFLLVFLSGCVKENEKNRVSTVETSIENRQDIIAEEKEDPPKPLIPESELHNLGRRVITYFSLIRDGNKRAALEMFLPHLRRTAESLISKDIELASEQPASYAPKTTTYVWYQNEKLWFREGAKLLTNDEIDRLITVSKKYERATVAVITFENGKRRNILLVKYGDEYYLLP